MILIIRSRNYFFLLHFNTAYSYYCLQFNTQPSLFSTKDVLDQHNYNAIKDDTILNQLTFQYPLDWNFIFIVFQVILSIHQNYNIILSSRIMKNYHIFQLSLNINIHFIRIHSIKYKMTNRLELIYILINEKIDINFISIIFITYKSYFQ